MGRTSVQKIIRGAICFILTWTMLSCWQTEVLLQQHQHQHTPRQLAELPEVPPSPVFPPYIFWTSKSLNMDDRAKRYMKRCGAKNQLYQSEFYTDEQARGFVHYHYPEFASAYDQLPAAVMRADVWRYLVVHQFGGIYMDTDVQCRSPIDQWDMELSRHDWFSEPRHIRMMVGIEFCNCTTSYGHLSGSVQFVQWIFGAQPKHPILYRAAQIAIANSQLPDATDPLTVTGPVVFSQAVLEHFVANGALKPNQINWARGEGEMHQVTNADFLNCRERNTLVGDVAVLNKQAFGYHREHVNSPDWASEEIYVEHHFFGTWRQKRIRTG